MKRPTRPGAGAALRVRLSELGCPEEMHAAFLAFLTGRGEGAVRYWLRDGVQRTPSYVARLLDLYSKWAPLREAATRRTAARDVMKALEASDGIGAGRDLMLLCGATDLPVHVVVAALRWEGAA